MAGLVVTMALVVVGNGQTPTATHFKYDAEQMGVYLKPCYRLTADQWTATYRHTPSGRQ